jgi:AcrR family transcriptional regulator
MEAAPKADSGRSDAPRRRGRPPSPELASRRRRELIEAAYHVFAERGYHAAGIADIAERLEIGHGTFYRYFESKRDILDHVVDYGLERLGTAISEEVSLERTGTFEELGAQVARIVERILEVLEDEPGLGRLILVEATSIDDAMTMRLLGFAEALARITGGYIKQGIAAGLIRDDVDVGVAARAVNAMLIPVFISATQGSFGPEERRRYAEGLISFAAHGLAAR